MLVETEKWVRVDKNESAQPGVTTHADIYPADHVEAGGKFSGPPICAYVSKDEHANLIAAAPDLLVAAQLFAEWIDTGDHLPNDFPGRHKLGLVSKGIHAAIAKAEGR